MKKKSRLILSIVCICFAVAILGFGVYAATSVTYTISGTITYQATGVFATVDTSVYVSKLTKPSSKSELQSNLAVFETISSDYETSTNTKKLDYSHTFTTIGKNTDDVINAQTEPISINYGSYKVSGQGASQTAYGFAYYIVANVKNYGQEQIGIAVTNNIDPNLINSVVAVSESNNLDGKGTEEYTQLNIVVALSLDNVQEELNNVDFDVQINIDDEPIEFEPEYYTFSTTSTSATITGVIDKTALVGEILLPSEYNGLPVTSIGANAFADCTQITKVTLPASIATIQSGAFKGCTNLTEINLTNMQTIGISAFQGCSSLKSIEMASITSIGEEAFDNCNNLESVVIKNTKFFNIMNKQGAVLKVSDIPRLEDGQVELVIGNNAFANCTSLKKFINQKATWFKGVLFSQNMDIQQVAMLAIWNSYINGYEPDIGGFVGVFSNAKIQNLLLAGFSRKLVVNGTTALANEWYVIFKEHVRASNLYISSAFMDSFNSTQYAFVNDFYRFITPSTQQFLITELNSTFYAYKLN